MIENDPLALAPTVEMRVEPLYNLTVLLPSARPVMVGVLSIAAVVTDKLLGAPGGVVSAAGVLSSSPPPPPLPPPEVLLILRGILSSNVSYIILWELLNEQHQSS